MIWKIARKEIAEHLLSFRFSLAAMLCAGVLLLSCLGMYRQYEQRNRDYTLCQARQGEALANIPPTLLSLFAWGLEDVTGRTVDLRYAPHVMVLGVRPPLNPFDTFFPTFDLSYVVRIIGALVALSFAFDAICREGSNGTLALMLAAGASRGGILLGKLAGGFSVVALLFLFPVFLGLALLGILFSIPLTMEVLARILLWSGASLLYLFCFFCLGLLISAFFTTPRLSLLVCLVFWTMLIFIAPSAVTSVAHVETRLQSPVRFAQENLFSSKLAASQGRSNQEEGDRQLQKREARSHEMLRFTDLTLKVLRLLPGAAYVDLSTNLAGTGVAEMASYYSAMQRYIGAVIAAREQKEEAPSFSFTRSPLGDCLHSSIVAIVSLMAWAVAALWSAGVALFHYDVRTKEVGQL